ncbi:MAG: hypothetical protein OEO21_04605 [Candidatus Krumholzibacteria bacterium]|nr:hypothetical protein [Candidatus Krumholzibacteria bacterium]
MKRHTLALMLAAATLVAAPEARAQDAPVQPRSVGINPIGLMFNGLSFVEYTHPMNEQVSFVARLDFIRWSEEEKEVEGYTDVYRSEYTESGKGPGAGVGLRYYMPLSKSVDFEISTGIDVLMVGWEWNERQYGADGSLSYRPDSGDGTTSAFAFHGGFGAKINVGSTQQFFVEPQVLFGTVGVSVENDSGQSLSGSGFFFGGALVLGMNLWQ